MKITKEPLPDIVVGIDPDCQESGVGVVVLCDRHVETAKMGFPLLIGYLKQLKEIYGYDKLLVVIEGGWLNDSNWHVHAATKYVRDVAARAAKIGRSTGMNHQTGMLIQQMCDHHGIRNKVVKPLKKCWKGKDGKITQAELEAYTVHGKLPRTNQDQRDAILLALVTAGLPLRAKAKDVNRG